MLPSQNPHLTCPLPPRPGLSWGEAASSQDHSAASVRVAHWTPHSHLPGTPSLRLQFYPCLELCKPWDPQVSDPVLVRSVPGCPLPSAGGCPPCSGGTPCLLPTHTSLLWPWHRGTLAWFLELRPPARPPSPPPPSPGCLLSPCQMQPGQALHRRVVPASLISWLHDPERGRTERKLEGERGGDGSMETQPGTDT